MSPSVPGDAARATVRVALDPAAAFRVFTEEIDRWWRRGVRFRRAPGQGGLIRLEPGAGGRIFESFGAAHEERVVVAGTTLVWEPPSRLVFEWRAANFAADEQTEVEVLFRGVDGGTEVTVIHRGWSTLRPDHPARHGLTGLPLQSMIGMWWAAQLTRYREIAPAAAALRAPPASS